MPITIGQLMADKSLFAKLRRNREVCVHCQVPLQETVTGKRKTPQGASCSDCYFEKLGEGIEKSPPTSGRIRRG